MPPFENIGVCQMKYTIVFFSTVGQCPWWCCDTDECGLRSDELRCTGKTCDIAPSMLPPSNCPAREVPNSEQGEASAQLTTGDNTAEALPEGEITPNCSRCVGGLNCMWKINSVDCLSNYQPA